MDTKERTVLAARGEERRFVWERINETLGEVQEWTEEVNVEFAV